MSLWKPHLAIFLLANSFHGLALAESTILPAPKANDVTFETKSTAPSLTTKNIDDSESTKDCFKKFKETDCLRQADAYQRASQAAKYLAFYMQMEKWSPEQMKDTKEAFARCFNTPKDCKTGDQEKILAASVQHNMGKEIRHMVVQNNTSMNNLRSMNSGANFLFDGKHGIGAGKAKELDNPFRLKVEEVGDSPAYVIQTKEMREKEILGPKFLNDYKAFIDTYAKTSGQYQFVDGSGTVVNESDKQHWHFVAQRINSTRAGGEMDVYAKAQLDMPKFTADRTTQDAKMVDDKIKEAKDLADLRGTDLEQNKDILSKQMNALMMNPDKLTDENGKAIEQKDIHRAMVADLNKKYDEAIAKKRGEESSAAARDPASVGNPKKAAPLDVDFKVAEFSQFLDEIWPPSAAKPANAPTK